MPSAYPIGTTGGWNVIDLMGAGPGVDESGLTETEFSLLQAAAAAEQAAQQQSQTQTPGGSHPGVEVLTFDPVGHGKSSIGHQAISVNGTTYSFGESGKWVELSTDVYLGKTIFGTALVKSSI
jgi:hypothetical protein